MTPMRVLEGDDDLRVELERSPSPSSLPPCVIPLSSFFSINNGISRKSTSFYDKLPQEPLKLTVLKLDGSTFDILVSKTATVAELKLAVEAAFSHLPKNGPGKVSWAHVWSQFCLSYAGQKLLIDSDCIWSYRIKDGDQLQFVRHSSINYNMVKKQSEKAVRAPDRPEIPDEVGAWGSREDNACHQENLQRDQDDEENNTTNRYSEYKLVHPFKGWLSYNKLIASEPEIIFKQRSRLPKLANGILGSFRNIFRLFSNKSGSQRKPRYLNGY